MSKIFIPNTVPSYIAESTDISGSKIDGVVYKGAEVYITDTGKKYVVKNDLTLEEIVNKSAIGTVEVSSGSIIISSMPNNVIGSMPIGGYTTKENLISGSAIVSGSSPIEAISAQGTEISIYATHLLVTNSGSSIGTYVNIEDGPNGNVKYSGYASKDGGGFSATLPAPLKFSPNTGVYIKCETEGTEVRVSISGYKE